MELEKKLLQNCGLNVLNISEYDAIVTPMLALVSSTPWHVILTANSQLT